MAPGDHVSPEEIAPILNRRTRRKSAQVTYLEEIPFGPALFIRRYHLGNGLEVQVLPDPTSATISYHTWFRVGSRYEQPGKTGLSHMFEHLMFKSTKNRPQGSFDRTIESHGGHNNAATWTDWTYYHENLPASALHVAVELESDRLANLLLDDSQVLPEKEVVANERRLVVDDDVEGAANEALHALAFRKHGYGWPTIGWMNDIQNYSTKDCIKFHRTYYNPGNAVVVVSGNVTDMDLLTLVQDHYGAIPARKTPPAPRTKEAAQRAERVKKLRWPTETEKLLMGYRTPELTHPDFVPLSMLRDILVGGRSARLTRRLVEKEESALQVRASLAPFQDPGLFDFWLDMRPGQKAQRALELLEQEIALIQKKGVKPWELEKAKNRFEVSSLSECESVGGRAEQAGFFTMAANDPSYGWKMLDQALATTKKDIQRVAQTYLIPKHRCRVHVLAQSNTAQSNTAQSNATQSSALQSSTAQ